MTTGEKQKSSSSNRQNVVLTRPVTPGLNPQPLSSSSQQFNASFRTFQNDRKKGPAHQSAPPNARMHPEPEPVRGFRHSPSTRGTTDTRAERSNLGDGGSLTRQHLLRPGTRPGANQREQRQIRRENSVPAPRRRRRRRGAPRRSGDGARARCRGGERGADRRRGSGDDGRTMRQRRAAARGRRRAAKGLEGLVGRRRAVAQSSVLGTGPG